MEISFKLDEFEGPLDLILHLISKHKMNICDIEILSLVDQFIAYLDRHENAGMEIAGEFIEMAARLVQMKTVFLLPKHDEEKEELKAQLAGELMEYKACKQAAMKLREVNLFGEIFSSAGEEISQDKTFNANINIYELRNSYIAAMGKGKRRQPPPVSAFTPLVSNRVVSVTSRIIFVLRSLYKSPKLQWKALFEKSGERSEMVATFLAVLELVKAKRVSVGEKQEYLIFNGRGAQE